MKKEIFTEYQKARRHQRGDAGWRWITEQVPPDLFDSFKQLVWEHKSKHYDVWYPRKTPTAKD